MKIQIEDYFGNDVIIIDYCLKDKSNVSDVILNTIEGVVHNHGYNIADIEENTIIRIQQEEADHSEEQVGKLSLNEEKILLDLVADLNKYLLGS